MKSECDIMTNMNKTTFPKLFHRGKNGKLHSFEIWSEGSTIYSLAGTDDGKKILSSRIATPKNEGKANATTAEQQATFECKAAHAHKLTRKYSLTSEQAVEQKIEPMLALKFADRKNKNVYYPCDVDPKLDGTRALAYWKNDRVILTSRGSREWLIPAHLNEQLEKFLPKDCVLDGEIYKHGYGFQKIASLVKRKQKETEELEFHVYDCPEFNGDDSLPWLERKKNLVYLSSINTTNNIIFTPHYIANNEEEVYALYEKIIEDYEGIMVRLHNALYTYGYRSSELLKLKPEEDAEYKIIGYTNGKGKFEKAVIWICEDEKGQSFTVTPKCTQEEKEKLYKNADQYIGQMLTVMFNDFTDKGLPRFGRGKGIKPVEEF